MHARLSYLNSSRPLAISPRVTRTDPPRYHIERIMALDHAVLPAPLAAAFTLFDRPWSKSGCLPRRAKRRQSRAKKRQSTTTKARRRVKLRRRRRRHRLTLGCHHRPLHRHRRRVNRHRPRHHHPRHHLRRSFHHRPLHLHRRRHRPRARRRTLRLPHSPRTISVSAPSDLCVRLPCVSPLLTVATRACTHALLG